MTHLYRMLAFCLGALVILFVLLHTGRVAGNAMGCNTGLGRRPSITYPAYEATIYGWPFKTVLVEQIGCEVSPEHWVIPRTVVTWYPSGIIVSLLEVLLGGLVGYWFSGGQ